MRMPDLLGRLYAAPKALVRTQFLLLLCEVDIGIVSPVLPVRGGCLCQGLAFQ